MIDLHSHILYEIDDGATTLEEALAMGRMAAADGIRTMAATPHSPDSLCSRIYDPALIRMRVAEINAALQAEQVPLNVVIGTEIAYSAGMVERLNQSELLPYEQSRTILLELANHTLPTGFEIAIFNLQVAGYRVVLAHPERIDEIQQNPNLLLPLIERGVLMQLTACALTGAQGKRLRSSAETLLTHGMVHLLASDAHGLPPRRSPQLAAARDRAQALIGPAAEALVTTNPAALLNNQPLQLPTPQPVSRRHQRWWHRDS